MDTSDVIFWIIMSIILLVFIFFVYFFMLYSKNINNTRLGQSVINNIYQTTISTSLSHYIDKGFILSEWNDNPIIWNSDRYNCYIKLPPGIKFQVIDVRQKYDFENGYSLKIKVKLLDDISLDLIEDYIETNGTQTHGDWNYVHKNILDTNNPYIRKIVSDFTILKMQGLISEFYEFQFFNYEYRDVIETNAITNKMTIIKNNEL